MIERPLPSYDSLMKAVDLAAARQHGGGYRSRHGYLKKGRRCNLKQVYGCTYCRTLAGLEN